MVDIVRSNRNKDDSDAMTLIGYSSVRKTESLPNISNQWTLRLIIGY